MKAPVPYSVGSVIAAGLAERLRAFPALFARVEVAGSVRRKRPTVGDVELVAKAAPSFQSKSVRTVLEWIGVQRGDPNRRGASAPWGDRYFRGKVVLPSGGELGVDLFVVMPPAEWGVVYLIRTGSAAFSASVVTRLHRWGLESRDGRIVRSTTGGVLPCPSESIFLRYARLPWIAPELRDPESREYRLAFSREWEPGEEMRTHPGGA